MRQLSPLDAQFLNIESRTTAGHVGCVLVLERDALPAEGRARGAHRTMTPVAANPVAIASTAPPAESSSAPFSTWREPT